ncbi:MoxR family ATPase [Vulcanisaeta sp. JCM 14467]|uniref:MoxR family ATPase n=1 Tax=Vulcanisaeta sp. JCM 14467 TaxID=1295370 RepID=UPI00318311BD
MSQGVDIGFIGGKVKAIVGEILSYYSGKEEVIKEILAAVLAGGHVLLEDVPGVGKTFLAKLIAKVSACSSRGFSSRLIYCPVT